MTGPVALLGVDGGGSKTAVRVAVLAADGRLLETGRAVGGPSNLRAIGVTEGCANLDAAIDDALLAAGTERIESAVLAIAGSQLADVRASLEHWAAKRSLARRVAFVHDLDPVLESAAGDGPGLALIVGTGSVAGGVNDQGQRTITGGWGHWFGDQGSGFDLGRQALAAVAGAIDGTAAATRLVDALLSFSGADQPREILRCLQDRGDVRRQIARCTEPLLDTALAGDEVARGIVDRAASSAAKLVEAAALRLSTARDVPLGLAGGVVAGSEYYRARLSGRLEDLGFPAASSTVVHSPVDACLKMAQRDLTAERRAG